MIRVRKHVDRDGFLQHKRLALQFTVGFLTKTNKIVHGRPVGLARNVNQMPDAFVFPQQLDHPITFEIPKIYEIACLQENVFLIYKFTDSAARWIHDDGNVRRDGQLFQNGLE